MPQSMTDYWKKESKAKDMNEYSRIVNNIGNIAVIDKKLNIKAKNETWSKKRKIYNQKFNNLQIASIANDNKRWNQESIKKRAEDIKKWVMEDRWNFTKIIDKLPTIEIV